MNAKTLAARVKTYDQMMLLPEEELQALVGYHIHGIEQRNPSDLFQRYTQGWLGFGYVVEWFSCEGGWYRFGVDAVCQDAFFTLWFGKRPETPESKRVGCWVGARGSSPQVAGCRAYVMVKQNAYPVSVSQEMLAHGWRDKCEVKLWRGSFSGAQSQLVDATSVPQQRGTSQQPTRPVLAAASA